MYKERQQFLEELLDGRALAGIEIGALDRPLVLRSDLPNGNEILYADHLSTEELKEKYKADPAVDLDAIVKVDLISAIGDFSECLQGRLVDYVVASHVIEHVPNPIRWLKMLFEIIRPGGFIFLVVPDKRYTFDYQRPTTTCGTMLQSFFSDKEMPSVADVFDHHSSAVLIDGSKVWSGLLDSGDLPPVASNRDALKYALEVNDTGDYHDVHVSVFTPMSFFFIIEKLIYNEIFMPKITAFKDTCINEIEFFVCMEKPEFEEISMKQHCLSSIPNFSLETLVSPYMPQVKSLSDALKTLTDVHQDFQKSFLSLEAKLAEQEDELLFMRNNVTILQTTLNRRSVKYLLKFLHFFCNIFLFSKGNKS
jgi:hypothetical protein